MVDLVPTIAELERFIEKLMQVDGSPGLALAVTDRERTLYIESFGLAEIASDTPVTEATRFQIGCIGKSLAADVLLALAAEGRVDLDAPVSDYLPWWQPRSEFAPITLHHLLSHTAGISSGADGSPDAVVEALTLAELGASTAPGERFHYSNGGYKVLGLVIEAITGRASAESIDERLLTPLGMADSTATITHAGRARLAVGYVGLYDDRPQHPNHPLVPATWLETDTADGSITATAGDMAIYARMLLNRGSYPGGRIYPDDAFARKITPAADAGHFGYGYGTIIVDNDGRTFVGHTGGMVGYVAGLAADLDAGLAAVALINGSNGSPNMLARHAISLFRAAQADAELPSAPLIGPGNPSAIPGTFHLAGNPSSLPVTFVLHGSVLQLRRGALAIPLVPIDDDAFLADHPDWDRFVVRIERDGGGDAVGFSHGGDWYLANGPAPDAAAHPAEWDAYTGHYRSHNPWISNFRVVHRRGELRLIFPSGPDGFDDDQPLVAIPGTDRFRVGKDTGGPERVSFDTIIHGKARRCWLSGAPFVRDFTP